MGSIFFSKPDPRELRLRTSGIRQLGVWLPPVLALLVIATESTDTFSGAHTSGWLRPICERIFGPIGDTLWFWLHHLLRKSGHLCGYGLVCLTFLRAWLITLARSVELDLQLWRLQSCAFAVVSTAVVASLDEWHQTFLPSRTGLVSDVGIDTMGAAFTCLVVWLVCWRREVRLRG